MKDHSLIKLLKSFSRAEIKEFGELISNSYFNKRKAVRKLFDIIKMEYPDFHGKEIEKRNVFIRLFPGKVFNENAIAVMTHYLHELAKRFIALKRFEGNELEYDFNLQAELISRKQFGNAEKSLEKHLKTLNPSDFLSEYYYLYKFRIKFEILYSLYESHSGNYEKFLDKIDFQGMYDDFYYHYIIKSMRLYLNVLHTEKFYNKEFSKEHFEKMFKEINITDYSDLPLVRIYYYLIRMMNDKNNEVYYFKVKEILREVSETINSEDLAEVYINMQNFIKKKLSEGKQNFQSEEFEIITKQLQSKTYVVNDNMSFIFYRNAVNTALRLNEFSWVKEFINDFKDDLPEEYRHNAFYYCSAQYEFAVKNYDASMEMLSKIKFDEVYQKYESKILQMMIYFETNSVEPLLSSLEAFRHFLKNNKLLPGNKKKPYLNFYKFFNKLVIIEKKKDKIDLIKVRNDLLKETPVNNKDWLLKKIDDILLSFQNTKKLKSA